VLLAMALLVACSGPGSSSSSSGGSGGVAAGSKPADSGNSGGSPTADTARQVVTTATASLAVKDPADSAQRVSQLVESLGGRVDERTEQSAPGSDRTVSADLVVRVPAAALTGLLADLKKLGDVASVSVSRSDVTATAVDLDARISALRTSVTRLQGLMQNAATTDALLAAEKALSERQANLESLQSQRALLADQVTLSTLTVHLRPLGVAPAGGPHGFLEGLGTGWRALVSALGVILVILGVVLPWLALAGLVAAAVLVLLRRVRRVQRRRATLGTPAEAPATPSPPPGPPQVPEDAPV
jgi:acetolactate synthase regulatory subunit